MKLRIKSQNKERMKFMIKFENARNYKKQIKHLYRTAFPKEERAPLFFLFQKARQKNNSFYAIVDNEEFVGLVYTIETEKMVYVFFFAIEEAKRGKGYGTKVLSLIKEMYPDRAVTLEIEDTADKDADNYTQRINRLGFYQRNGFKQLQIRVNEAGVVFELLSTEEGITREEFLGLMKNFLGATLFRFVYRMKQ